MSNSVIERIGEFVTPIAQVIVAASIGFIAYLQYELSAENDRREEITFYSKIEVDRRIAEKLPDIDERISELTDLDKKTEMIYKETVKSNIKKNLDDAKKKKSENEAQLKEAKSAEEKTALLEKQRQEEIDRINAETAAAEARKNAFDRDFLSQRICFDDNCKNWIIP